MQSDECDTSEQQSTPLREIPTSWTLTNPIDQIYSDDYKSLLTAYAKQSGTIIKATALESDRSYYFQLDQIIVKVDGVIRNNHNIRFLQLKNIIYQSAQPTILKIDVVSLQRSYNCIYEWEGNIIEKLKTLDYDQRNAILAYRIIDFIINIKKEQFYVNQKTSIGERVIKKLKQQYDTKFKQNVDYFEKLFLQGISYKHFVFDQIRFKEGQSYKNKAQFFPSFVTQDIFIWLKSSKKDSILYGNSGVGKSWAFNFILELFKFPQKVIAAGKLKRIHNFINIKLFKQFPKVFYHSLRQRSDPKLLLEDFKSQIQFPISKQLQNQISQAFKRSSQHNAIAAIEQAYLDMGFRVVYMIDQINRYYALLRNYRNIENSAMIHLNMDLVLGRCFDGTKGAKLFSSSLNQQALQSLNLANKPNIDILSLENVHQIDWIHNAQTQYGLYQTLNFIRFQILRLLHHHNSVYQSKKQPLIVLVDRVYKQFEAILSYDKLMDKLQYYVPVTPLKIRQSLQKEEFFRKTIIGKSDDVGFQKNFISKLSTFLSQLAYRALQKVSKELYRFVFQKNSNSIIASAKLKKIFLVLKEVQQYIQKFPKKQKQQKIFNFKLSCSQLFLNETSTKQQYSVESNDDTERKRIKVKDEKLEFLDKNVFYYDQKEKVITTYLPPIELRDVIKQLLSKNIGSRKNSMKQQRTILDQFFQLSMHQQGSCYGRIFDAVFAKVIASQQFTLSFTRLDGTKQTYQIKNTHRYQRKFVHFLSQVSTQAKKNKQSLNNNVVESVTSPIQAQEDYQGSQIKNNVPEDCPTERKKINVENDQKCSIKIPKYISSQSFKDKDTATSKLLHHFSDLLQKSQQMKQGNFDKDQWIGAAPCINPGLGKKMKLSPNSPSIDAIFMRYNKDQQIYEMITIDFTIDDLQPSPICRRLQKAAYYLNLIEDMSKSSSYQINCRHILLATNQVLKRFDKMKSNKKHQSCGIFSKFTVLSIEEMAFHTSQNNDASVRNYFFSKVLPFVKGEIYVRDKKYRNQQNDEDDCQDELETANLLIL